MVLKREAYRMLEEIVGPECISEDPAVLDGYAWQWGAEFLGKGNRFTIARPDVVVMPGSTEEVQAIVKVCNRHGIIFKAHSTGWGTWGIPVGGVSLDLRRMNRIQEINEEDMYAIVEPYVTWGQLQAESMKRGLNCVTIGAGSGTSALASCTAVMGGGYNNLTMGYNDRNVLGVEWVLPDGEVLKLGSLGSGAGWISGDGPGPSLRGIMRGYWGTFGGLGVFTKCAVRLYQWGGPPELLSRNIVPMEEKLVEYPENVAIYYPFFDSYEKRDEALFKIGEAEIGYAAAFMGRGLLCFGMGVNNRASIDLRTTLADAMPAINFMVLLVSNSKREFEYQKKVLNKILEETGGQNFYMIEDPSLRDMATLLLVKGGNMPARGVFGTAGSFLPTMCGGIYLRRTLGKAESSAIEIKKKYAEEGSIAHDMGEGQWGSWHDGAHVVYQENETHYDPNDPRSTEAMYEAGKETMKELTEKNITSMPVTFDQVGGAKLVEKRFIHEFLGPRMSDYHVWLKKIKKAFDSNCVSDPTTYTTPE